MNFYRFFSLIKLALFAALLGAFGLARADYVGESQTTKYLDPVTRDMISARYQAGQGGLVVGDEISYIIEFTPYPGGTTEMIGGGAYLTDYIPVGTQVVNAQFVQRNADGSYTQIAPPPPAAMQSIFVPQYSETGIFYSTDPRTAMYTNNASTTISGTNGYTDTAGNNTIHNAWDYSLITGTPDYVANPTSPANCPASTATVPSPVAGPDAFITTDRLGQGPWHRISYAGSMIGTAQGVVNPAGGCIGGTPTSAGWQLSSTNPLPSNVNAVRFAGGQTTVGQLFSVRITLRLTQPLPATGLVNNSEVYGGDVSFLNTGAFIGRSNIWRYVYPSVANANTTLTVVKRIVGMCVGAACVPKTYLGGAVPNIANLKLRYEILYLNSSGAAQTNVKLTDTAMPTGGSLVANSAVVVNGPNVLPTTGGPTGSFSFAPISSLGSGAGGSVQFDVLFAAAPGKLVPLVNAAKLTSTSLPTGVESFVTTTSTSQANISAGKTTSTPTRTTVAPNNVAQYTITIPNLGLANATKIVAYDYLPTSGASTLAADMFIYLPGSVSATITDAAGVTTALAVPTVTTAIVAAGATGNDAMYVGRQKVTFTFPTGQAIVSQGSLAINFSATIGANVPQRTSPYLNDLIVSYDGGTTVAGKLTESLVSGAAPVTVTVPITLTKGIECVFVGASCLAYTNGNIATGSKVRYRLTYGNTSAGDLAGAVLTDTLPTGTSFVSGSATDGASTPISAPTQAGQVLTFGAVNNLPASSSGVILFDMLLGGGITSGTNITNNAKLTTTSYPGGVVASVTSSILNQANLEITKTTSTPTIAVNGLATYTITVTNTGGANATAIKVYDWLPFYSATANANTRFNFTVGSTAFALQNGGASTLATIAPVTTIGAANIAPYNTKLNQQQVLWTFTPAQTLAPGASFTLTFTAAAGAAGGIPAGSTIFKNDAQIAYTTAAQTFNSATLQTAPLTIPTNLSITKTIDCVYNTGLTACNAYSGGGVVPVGAKVRYKIHYQNNALTAQTNVYICDQISSSTGTLTATLTSPAALAPTPVGVFVNTAAPNGPPTATLTNPANALCVIPVLAGSTTFSYPVIPSLAAGGAGDVYYDVATNMTSGATLTNTGKIVSVQAPSGEISTVQAVALNVPILSATKSTTTPSLSPGGIAQYTITVTNNGNAPTTALRVYDFLPYSAGADATTRFAYIATGAITGSTGCNAPTTTTPAVPPTVVPYSSNLNQQEVKWNFPTCALAAGGSVSIPFTATVGSAMPAGVYGNSVQADFDSTAGSGGTSANMLAPVTIATGVAVSGKVYSDANFNNIADVAESWSGAPNMFVKIAPYSAGSCAIAATAFQPITAPNGTYSFAAIPAGQYCLTLSTNSTLSDVTSIAPAGWMRVSPLSGIQVITVSNLDLNNQNFGLFNGSIISGRVFRDNGVGVANDGVQGAGETGIAGVTMTATHGSCTSAWCVTTTDGNGDFIFRLPAAIVGAVSVVETNPNGMLSTGGNAGTTGGTYTRTSDTTAFTVVVGSTYTGLLFGDVPDNQFMTDGALAATPGSIVFYPHRFVAGTTGTVTFNVSQLPSPAMIGWSELIYQDTNCDSVMNAGDVPVTANMAVTAGTTVCLLVKEFVPANAAINAQNALTLTANMGATFSGTPVSFSYVRHDTTTVGQASAAGLSLVKRVSTTTALPGDNITYYIDYSNNSSGPLSNVVISDATPAYTTYQSASCGTLPLNFSGCSITAPSIGATGGVVFTFAGSMNPSTTGTVSFTVKIQP